MYSVSSVPFFVPHFVDSNSVPSSLHFAVTAPRDGRMVLSRWQNKDWKDRWQDLSLVRQCTKFSQVLDLGFSVSLLRTDKGQESELSWKREGTQEYFCSHVVDHVEDLSQESSSVPLEFLFDGGSYRVCRWGICFGEVETHWSYQVDLSDHRRTRGRSSFLDKGPQTTNVIQKFFETNNCKKNRIIPSYKNLILTHLQDT